MSDSLSNIKTLTNKLLIGEDIYIYTLSCLRNGKFKHLASLELHSLSNLQRELAKQKISSKLIIHCLTKQEDLSCLINSLPE